MFRLYAGSVVNSAIKFSVLQSDISQTNCDKAYMHMAIPVINTANTHPIWNGVCSIVSLMCRNPDKLRCLNCSIQLFIVITVQIPHGLSSIVIDCVRKACILCAIVINCVESYVMSYGDLVSIIYLIDYNTTLRNTINNKNIQPYHIIQSMNLILLQIILNNASNIPSLYTIIDYSQEFERTRLIHGIDYIGQRCVIVCQSV